jgi:thiol:disulfide interchange protein DsbD
MIRTLVFIAALFPLVAGPAMAQIDSLPKVQARLISERTAIASGQTVAVALEENIRTGWHTYWINPGEAGAPTELQWTMPPGWQASAIEWPFPKKLPVGPLMNYGYEGKVWLLLNVTAPRDVRPGDTVVLQAAARWLVCKDVCIPEDTSLTLPMKIAAQPGPLDPANIGGFAAARAKLPVASPWPLRYRLGDKLKLFVAAPMLTEARPVSADFFPLSGHDLKMSAPQSFAFASDGMVLDLAPTKKFHTGDTLAGVLVLTSRDGSVQALNVSAREGLVPQTDFMSQASMTIPLALLFAFIGGVILNLMPCVLPVLAMKALALANQSRAHRHETRLEGWTYGAGAVLSFLALGLLLIVLRAGGAEIGWGFQLQEPIVVACFALLMFAVGLNLSGVYEINPVAAGEALTRRGGAAGAFFTGILAVAVAAPCTVPFMAAALGFALTQSSAVALGVFAMLGIGFAAPFVALGEWPRLQRLLPHPGAWMNILKQALAFPMYGAAVWLIWVLTLQTNATGIAAALSSLVLFAFAMWLWSVTRNLSTRGRALGTLATLIGLIASFSCLALLPHGSEKLATVAQLAPKAIASEPYTEARLSDLRASHRAVFVDATAAWCITCLVNDEAVLSRPSVRQAFLRNHVAFLLADWTNRSPEITRLIESNGRSGVPLYLYYAPGAEKPRVLSQILTEGEVVSTLEEKGS